MREIWVDASYRDGIAALAVVGRGVRMKKIVEGLKNSNQAEAMAVRWAKDLVVERGLMPCVILCDSTAVVAGPNKGKKIPGVSVEWRSRKQNRAHQPAIELLRSRISHPDPTSVSAPVSQESQGVDVDRQWRRRNEKIRVARETRTEEPIPQYGPLHEVEKFWRLLEIENKRWWREQGGN